MDLVDTSVWARKGHPLVRPWFEEAALAGSIGLCDQIVLEILNGVAKAEDYAETADACAGYPFIQMSVEDWQRARSIHAELGRYRARHRTVPIADLLIAAAAEREGWTLIHYDRHFDLVREVTRQPMRWVVKQGSLT